MLSRFACFNQVKPSLLNGNNSAEGGANIKTLANWANVADRSSCCRTSVTPNGVNY